MKEMDTTRFQCAHQGEDNSCTCIYGGGDKYLREPRDRKSTVNHPDHYQGKRECIDEMVAMFGVDDVKAFCRCNIYKYRFRADKKGGKEDLKKADWYMDKLIELEDNHG